MALLCTLISFYAPVAGVLANLNATGTDDVIRPPRVLQDGDHEPGQVVITMRSDTGTGANSPGRAAGAVQSHQEPDHSQGARIENPRDVLVCTDE